MTMQTRRAFLVAGGAAALTACGATKRRRETPRPQQDVVIVGAGLAGLTCAYRLSQKGIRARVYEAADRVGGRAWTLRGHFADGQSAERGGEFVDSSHRALRGLIDELGLRTIDLYSTGPDGLGALTVLRGRQVADATLLEAFRDVLPALTADVNAIATPVGARAIDRISVAEWLDTRIAGGRRSALGRYLEIVHTTESGIDVDELSAIVIVEALSTSSANAFEPIGSSDERFVIAGGSERVPEELVRRLGAGAIETDTPLEAIRANADGSTTLTFASGTTARDVRADRVVLTLPFTALRRCDLIRAGFSPERLRAIRELGMGTSGKLHLQFTRRVWYELGADGDLESDRLQTVWDETWGRDGASGILVDYTGGKRGATVQEKDAPTVLRELDRILPGVAAAHNGRVASDRWADRPWHHGSYSGYLVGQVTTLSGTIAGPAGRIHFAGEHTSSESQGFMNGAVESGERAAAEVTAG